MPVQIGVLFNMVDLLVIAFIQEDVSQSETQATRKKFRVPQQELKL